LEKSSKIKVKHFLKDFDYFVTNFCFELKLSLKLLIKGENSPFSIFLRNPSISSFWRNKDLSMPFSMRKFTTKILFFSSVRYLPIFSYSELSKKTSFSKESFSSIFFSRSRNITGFFHSSLKYQKRFLFGLS